VCTRVVAHYVSAGYALAGFSTFFGNVSSGKYFVYQVLLGCNYSTIITNVSTFTVLLRQNFITKTLNINHRKFVYDYPLEHFWVPLFMNH